MGDSGWRMYKQSPAIGAPGKGSIFIRNLGVDTQGIVIKRAQQLAPLIQSASFFTQPIDGLTGVEIQSNKPTLIDFGYRG